MGKLGYVVKVLGFIKKLILNALADTNFVKSFTKLICGTAGAQVFTVVTLPFLTHMYSVESFGLQAVYVSITGILIVMASGRYELAILLPEKDEDAFSLVVMSIFLSVLVCCVAEAIVIFFSNSINSALNVSGIVEWLYFMPFTIIAGLSYNVGCIWLNRMKAYNIMPMTGIINSAGNFCASYSYGYIYDAEAKGLLLNTIVGPLLGAGGIFWYCWKKGWLPRGISIDLIKKQAVRYKNFPQFLVVGHMINVFSLQLPVFLLQSLAGQQVVGYFAMVQKFMVIPSSLIGSAIGNVFMREASEEWRMSHICWGIYKKTCILLTGIGIIVFPIIFVAAPDLLPYFLGEKWRMSGEYIRYLCPMFFMSFIASPLSSMFAVAEKLKWDLIIQVVRCAMIYGGMMAVFSISQTGDGAVVGYGLAFFVFHFWNMLITMKWARGESYF